jgi:hypothetical protein
MTVRKPRGSTIMWQAWRGLVEHFRSCAGGRADANRSRLSVCCQRRKHGQTVCAPLIPGNYANGAVRGSALAAAGVKSRSMRGA